MSLLGKWSKKSLKNKNSTYNFVFYLYRQEMTLLWMPLELTEARNTTCYREIFLEKNYTLKSASTDFSLAQLQQDQLLLKMSSQENFQGAVIMLSELVHTY